jgi:hypothetical protein
VPFGAGSLVVPIDNSPKMVYFAREVGIDDLLIDVDDPDLGARIVANVERCHDEYDVMQDRAAKERERLYDVTLENLARIYHALTGEMPDERECLPLGELEVWLSSRLHAKTMLFEGRTRGEGAQADRAAIARAWLRERREELYADGDVARATQVRRALEVVSDPTAPATTVGRGARYVRRRLGRGPAQR